MMLYTPIKCLTEKFPLSNLKTSLLSTIFYLFFVFLYSHLNCEEKNCFLLRWLLCTSFLSIKRASLKIYMSFLLIWIIAFDWTFPWEWNVIVIPVNSYPWSEQLNFWDNKVGTKQSLISKMATKMHAFV